MTDNDRDYERNIIGGTTTTSATVGNTVQLTTMEIDPDDCMAVYPESGITLWLNPPLLDPFACAVVGYPELNESTVTKEGTIIDGIVIKERPIFIKHRQPSDIYISANRPGLAVSWHVGMPDWKMFNYSRSLGFMKGGK